MTRASFRRNFTLIAYHAHLYCFFLYIQDTSVPNTNTSMGMMSPRRPRGKVLATMLGSGTTPHGRLSTSKYVITPHTPQEHEMGLILATLAGTRKTEDNDASKEEPDPEDRAAYSLTFPELVHKMVMETDASNPKVIRWTHDGEAFVVSAKVRVFGLSFVRCS